MKVNLVQLVKNVLMKRIHIFFFFIVKWFIII